MSPALSDFSFSTSWNWRNSKVGSAIMEEILSLGFKKVELNYRISEGMLETIEPMVARGELEVPSVHNVFPAVDDERFDTDSRLLGYDDPELRRRAVELTVRSAERGAALGAKALVVHPGVMPPDREALSASSLSGLEWDRRLKELYERGFRKGQREFDGPFEEFSSLRARLAPPELERVVRSLEEVANRIERLRLGMRIGVENRPMCWQIPVFAEMDYILEKLAGAPLGLWFDTGHGAMMRHLGFFDDAAEAAKIAGPGAANLVGMHIHDVDGVDDHFSPYTREGQDRYLSLIAAAPIKVIELGAKNPREAVAEGCAALVRALADRKEG
jgi:sugar phosphate isomerase/epimerase